MSPPPGTTPPPRWPGSHTGISVQTGPGALGRPQRAGVRGGPHDLDHPPAPFAYFPARGPGPPPGVTVPGGVPPPFPRAGWSYSHQEPPSPLTHPHTTPGPYLKGGPTIGDPGGSPTGGPAQGQGGGYEAPPPPPPQGRETGGSTGAAFRRGHAPTVRRGLRSPGRACTRVRGKPTSVMTSFGSASSSLHDPVLSSPAWSLRLRLRGPTGPVRRPCS